MVVDGGTSTLVVRGLKAWVVVVAATTRRRSKRTGSGGRSMASVGVRAGHRICWGCLWREGGREGWGLGGQRGALDECAAVKSTTRTCNASHQNSATQPIH